MAIFITFDFQKFDSIGLFATIFSYQKAETQRDTLSAEIPW